MRSLAVLVVLVRVAAADPGGDLRVDVRCADTWATPETGLTVLVDGVPTPALGENGLSGFELAVYHHIATPIWTWNPTDIGFPAGPGPHRVAIQAPGCALLTQDVAIAPDRATFISGRLPVDDPRLDGPTGAPNGFGISLGAVMRARPAHGTTNDLFQSTYAFDQTTLQGGALALSYEHRALAFAVDMAFATGTNSGTSMYQQSTRSTFTGSEYDSRFGARVGARLPMHEVAFAAGTGVGMDMIISSETTTMQTLALTPSGLDADLYVPLWAQLTMKPGCSWGATLYASYDVHPAATEESAPSFGASLLFQPSAACSEPSGLRAH